MEQPLPAITNQTIAEKAQRSHAVALYEDGDALYYDHGEHLLRDVAATPTVRLDTNLLGYCSQGNVQLTINGIHTECHAQQGFICPSNTRVADIRLSADAELQTLCVSKEWLTSMLHNKMDTWYRAVYIDGIRTLDLSGPNASLATAFYKDLLHFRMHNQGFSYSHEVIKMLIQTIVIDVCSMLVEQTSPSLTPNTASARLFGQFIALLSATEVKHQPVAHYADQLCISAKHLAKVCRQQSGHSAAYWITEAIKEDIKHALADTQQSNKEIADRLGLGSPSFFGRYVRQQFGLTPAQLRRELLGRQ